MHNTSMGSPAGPVRVTAESEKVTVERRDDYREEYANSVQVNVSIWDFFLQFGLLKVRGPNDVTFDSFQGVYMSPQQAKALHLVLAQNIAQYESAFGEIRIENPASAPAGRVQ